MANIVQIIIALLFIFVLPGFTFVRALFPRKGELDMEYNLLYQITLGMGLSIVLTILVGFMLASLPINTDTNKGYFDAPYIWAALILITVVFFVIGWWRGAYPFMGKLHPKLARMPPQEPLQVKMPDEKTAVRKLRALAAERQRLRWVIRDAERKTRASSKSVREYYARKKENAEKRLRQVDEELKKLEEQRATELYGESENAG